MDKKRMFQVLDEMNVHDTEHNTQLVSLHPDLIEMRDMKQGVRITMGVPHGVVSLSDQLYNRKKRIVLMVVDGAEFDKRMGIEPELKTLP